MQINEIFRRAKLGNKDYNVDLEIIDGCRNFHFVTAFNGLPKIDMGRGIYPAASINGITPAIFLTSNPYKAGSSDTPWHDVLTPDIGHIRYFGDNKIKDSKAPVIEDPKKAGNLALIKQFNLHSSNKEKDRQLASPLLCFKTEKLKKDAKGFMSFQGLCIIERVELVTQIDNKTNLPFSNYCFDLLVLSNKDESEYFNYQWINERRIDPLSKKAFDLAPASWKQWVKKGKDAFSLIRRNALDKLVISESKQQPSPNTPEDNIRTKIYNFYGGKKSSEDKGRFEYLASLIAERVINKNGGSYTRGWVTNKGRDGGVDFIGRLDVGSEFAKTKIIVLGQAKCESFEKATNGQHIARTVARLKRGWIGAYVTTSYFSTNVQKEILSDNYPIIMIDGLRLAQEFRLMMIENGKKDITNYIKEIDNEYEYNLMNKTPEEVLYI